MARNVSEFLDCAVTDQVVAFMNFHRFIAYADFSCSLNSEGKDGATRYLVLTGLNIFMAYIRRVIHWLLNIS